MKHTNVKAYSHDSIHQSTFLFGALQSFHGPLVHGRSHPGVVYIQQPESCHVHPTVAVRLQVQCKQILWDETEVRIIW